MRNTQPKAIIKVTVAECVLEIVTQDKAMVVRVNVTLISVLIQNY